MLIHHQLPRKKLVQEVMEAYVVIVCWKTSGADADVVEIVGGGKTVAPAVVVVVEVKMTLNWD